MNPWSGLKQLPREIWILSLAVLINRAGTMVLPFLVLYVTRGLHYSATTGGLVVALYGAGALITAPLSGWLTDRYGTVLIMRSSLFLSALVLFVFPFADSFTTVVAATLLLAITSEMFRPANLAVVSHLVPPEKRKAAFALLRLAINLGMSIGPALGGFLATVSFSYLFFIDGITSLAAAIVLVFSRFPVPAHLSYEGSEVPRPARRAVADRRFLAFLTATVLITVVFFQHLSTMPLYMVRNLHLSEATYGLMFTINTLLIVFLEVPINLATSHWSHRRTQALGALLFSIGFGSSALVEGIWGVIGTVIIWTFGEMILFPGMSAYVSSIAPDQQQGEYMGYYTMAFSLSFIIGPWLGTTILEHLGGSVLWSTMFLIGIASTLMMIRLREEIAVTETD
jgi:MFS family permease